MQDKVRQTDTAIQSSHALLRRWIRRTWFILG
jgi:hypothetical protein